MPAKQRWTKEEDEALARAVAFDGRNRWSSIVVTHQALLAQASTSNNFPKRSSKQCRERWNNNLRPDLRRGSWSEAEDIALIDLFKRFGNKFTAIGAGLGRADVHVRNRIHSTRRMVNRHRNGCQSNNLRKEGVLFKFFLALAENPTSSSNNIEKKENINTNLSTWTPPSSWGTTPDLDITELLDSHNNKPTTNQHTTDQRLFFAIDTEASAHKQQPVTEASPCKQEPLAALDSSSLFFPSTSTEQYSKQSGTGSGAFQSKAPSKLHIPSAFRSNAPSKLHIPSLIEECDEVSIANLEVQTNLFVVDCEQPQKRKSATWLDTPGSWSQNFSFWETDSPMTTHFGGDAESDFSVPKPVSFVDDCDSWASYITV